MSLSVIVLTKNEELHLERCLKSVASLCKSIIIVDCGSSDSTLEIAKRFSAKVFFNPWVNYSEQFNYGLSRVDPSTEWIMRIDADEYLTPELQISIGEFIKAPILGVDGIYFARRMKFMGQSVRYGGLFPAYMLRLFRNGRGRIESRWMDEHIKVDGKTYTLNGELIDDNLNSLTWWIEKHNKYASREAVDILNSEYRFMLSDSIASLSDRTQSGAKRWIKERVYNNLPLGLRALVYFMYRFFVRGGFFDNSTGVSFHVLQGFWYRYLVDCKVREVKSYMYRNQCNVLIAIDHVLDIRL